MNRAAFKIVIINNVGITEDGLNYIVSNRSEFNNDVV